MTTRLRGMVRGWISKVSRRRLIEAFVRHRYWLNQGNNSFASLPWPPIEKIAIVAAVGKYLLGDNVDNTFIQVAFVVYCVWRFSSRWFVGRFWHNHGGYDIETEWNRGKTPPGRVEMINTDELAVRVAMYLRMDKGNLVKKIEEDERRAGG